MRGAQSYPLSLHEVAQAREVREILQWFTREKQWINDIHQQLCRIPAPTFLESQRAEWFLGQMRASGLNARIDRAGNVLAMQDPAAEGPFVALTAHLDTVLAPRTKDDIGVSPDGKFYGPGVSDNGAGLAALLAIAKAIQSVPGADFTQLLLVANVAEEGEGNLNGMRALCKDGTGGGLLGKIRSFLVLDGATTDHITSQALGSRRFEVLFTGPGGHSWSDYGTANAVHALARAVALFSETRIPGTPRSSLNVGVIEGGSSINAIPAQARAKVDIRSERNDRMDDLVQALNAAVDRAQEIENARATVGRVTGKIKEIGSRPAARLPDNASILSFIRAVDSHLGIRSHIECASTDANIPLSLGIPAISIGAGGQGGGAHTLQEWFSPEGRDLGLKRIFLMCCLLLNENV
jgi:acetylornithine deacetylase/succinyl-diaminopimelate desuccinylase-like protein